MTLPIARLHELKIWPEFFEDVRSGAKTYEIRINDREFKLGDRLFLKEWDPESQIYTLNECIAEIVHITFVHADPLKKLLPSNVCVMGIRVIG